jgi:hypothetical protein
VRVHDVHAKMVRVKVLYAHHVSAKDGTVGKILDALPDDVLARALGTANADQPLLEADVLYAHDIKTDALEADEVHVTDLKLHDKP